MMGNSRRATIWRRVYQSLEAKLEGYSVVVSTGVQPPANDIVALLIKPSNGLPAIMARPAFSTPVIHKYSYCLTEIKSDILEHRIIGL